MTEPTPAERKAWREKHREAPNYQNQCWSDAFVWPCPVVRLLDALEAAEQRETWLRECLCDDCKPRGRIGYM